MKWSILNEIFLKSWVACTCYSRRRCWNSDINYWTEGRGRHSSWCSKALWEQSLGAESLLSTCACFPKRFPCPWSTTWHQQSPSFLIGDLTWKRTDKSTCFLTLFTWAVIKSVTYPHVNCFCVSRCRTEKPQLSLKYITGNLFVVFPANRHLVRYSCLSFCVGGSEHTAVRNEEGIAAIFSVAEI